MKGLPSCQQEQYGSGPSATLKMNEQHLSSPNNKGSQLQKKPPTLEARGGWAAASCLHVSLKERKKKTTAPGRILAENSQRMTHATFVRWLERLVLTGESIESRRSASRGDPAPPSLQLAFLCSYLTLCAHERQRWHRPTPKTVPRRLFVHFDHRISSPLWRLV